MTKKKSNNIGEVIRLYRKSNNLTQEKLAEKINLTYQQLQNYESGRSTPPLKMLIKIVEVLDIPSDLFFKKILQDSLDHYKQIINDNSKYIELIKTDQNFKEFIDSILNNLELIKKLDLTTFIKKLTSVSPKKEEGILDIYKGLKKLL